MDALHPTDQTLSSFGLGKLDESSAEAVSKHLEECDDCRKRVAEMSSDSFLDRVRDARKASGLSQAGVTTTGEGKKNHAPPPADTLPPGLADHPDYEVKRELGRGGMGVVYLAHNRLMGRDEVLKVMGRQIMERHGVLERFLREIRAVARLRHANIVSAYSAVHLGDSIVFAMEYVEGLDLSKMVKAKGPLPVSHACHFVYQAALGLQHAYEEGLVHRDIKPANLMLSRKGDKATVKVLDFGLAKAAREEKVDSVLTSQGQALGTPDYIAPEQILDAPSADIRADIYSLGGTLYYLLTGRPPFKAGSLYDLYQAHISRDADPLNLVRPEVPAELAALVAKMMAKDPVRRFQTPGEVAQALKPFFKSGAAAPVGSKPDLSKAISPEPKRETAGAGPVPMRAAVGPAPVTASPGSKPGPTPRSEPMWESLVDLKETEGSPAPAPAAASNRRPPWLWPAAAVGVLLLAFLAVWASGVIKVKTPEGYIVLIDLDPQATVLVDGTKAAVHWPDGGGPAEITVIPGGHVIQVKKDGFKIQGQTVTVERDGRRPLMVQLEPLEAPRPGKGAADNRPSPSDIAGPPPAPVEREVTTPTPKPPPVQGANPNVNPTVAVDDKDRKTDPSPRGANEPARAQAIDAAIALRGKAEIVSGSWLVEGRELVHRDAGKDSFGKLRFGDLRWTDYDFTVELMREKGLGDTGLTFHRTLRNNNQIWFGFGGAAGEEADHCGLIAFKDGKEKMLHGGVKFHLVDRRWYRARVSVRRNHIVCTVHDDQGNEHVHLEGDYDRLPSGQVGLNVGSSYRFRNIKVTSPDGKTLWEMPPAIGAPPPAPGAAVAAPGQQAGEAVPPRPGANAPAQIQAIDAAQGLRGKVEIRSGLWLVEGRELVQTDTTRDRVHWMLFGDPHWTDYDFTVDWMRVKGNGDAGLHFRRSPWNGKSLDFFISGGRCGIAAIGGGEETELKEAPFRLIDRKWYHARVSVRRNHIVSTLHDDMGNELVNLVIDDDLHPSGQVGLATEGSSYRFKNIRVTDPDGSILWEMPPAIGAPPPAPGAAVAAPGQQAGKAVPRPRRGRR